MRLNITVVHYKSPTESHLWSKFTSFYRLKMNENVTNNIRIYVRSVSFPVRQQTMIVINNVCPFFMFCFELPGCYLLYLRVFFQFGHLHFYYNISCFQKPSQAPAK